MSLLDESVALAGVDAGDVPARGEPRGLSLEDFFLALLARFDRLCLFSRAFC